MIRSAEVLITGSVFLVRYKRAWWRRDIITPYRTIHHFMSDRYRLGVDQGWPIPIETF